MTPFGKHEGRTLAELGQAAALAALEDAGVSATDLDLVVAANSMAGLLQGRESIRGQVILSGTLLAGIPVVNVENACASSSSAVQVAMWAIAAGQARVALVVGVEKLVLPDKTQTWQALASASDVGEEASGRPLFMEFYARRAREHMEQFGTTIGQLAAVAVKNRRHGALNPYAQFREEVTIDQVLESRPVAPPLTLLMCSPITDGAAAIVLARRDVLDSGRPIVAIRGAGIASGNGVGPEYETIRQAATRAYRAAGIGPQDVDVAELHDAAAIAEIEAYEALGFAERGAGGSLAASGETALGGRLPINPSGGLSSRGHPVGATGVAQLVELTWQLRGQCGDRQVESPTVALAENHGGLVGSDVAVATVTVLERVA